MILHKMLLVVLLPLLLGGCSYSFRGRAAGDIQSIAVPSMDNESTEFGIAETLTDELIRGFQRDGTLRITNEDQADAILIGRVLNVSDEPYSALPGATITVEEYRFAMTCEFELINRESQETVWSQRFPAWAVYPYGGSLENRDAAIQEATDKLLQDILNKIVGDW